jgi:hypothetical protein
LVNTTKINAVSKTIKMASVFALLDDIAAIMDDVAVMSKVA